MSKRENDKQQQQPGQSRSMFSENFVERRDLEQYFWTDDTVLRILKALAPIEEGRVCCLTTPTLANGFYQHEARAERLLDIDRRFDFLPKFTYFDILNPPEEPLPEDYWITVVNPPFFYIPMEDIFKAVVKVCNGDYSKKLMIGFLIREEAELLKWFQPFGLKRTKFVLEYQHVKPNKWRNYALYSNVSLQGISFMK